MGTPADALFWVAVTAALIAHTFILRSTIRGMRTTAAQGLPFREWIWAVLPALALIVLFVWTWRTMHPSSVSALIAATPGTAERFRS